MARWSPSSVPAAAANQLCSTSARVFTRLARARRSSTVSAWKGRTPTSRSCCRRICCCLGGPCSIEHGPPRQQQILLQHERDVGVRPFHALTVDERLALARRVKTRADVEQS